MVTAELTRFMQNLLKNENWTEKFQTVIEGMLKSEDEEEKMLAFSVLGGDIEGLRMGGKVITLIQDSQNFFENNVLLKYNGKFKPQTGRIIGFCSEYIERSIKDEKDPKKNKDAKLDVDISIGASTDSNNPLVLYDNSFSNQITNLINVDIGL